MPFGSSPQSAVNVLPDDVCALDERASRAQKKPQRSKPLHAGRPNPALTGSLINHRETGGPNANVTAQHFGPLWCGFIFCQAMDEDSAEDFSAQRNCGSKYAIHAPTTRLVVGQ
jgi:hypothetical protein